MSARIVAWALVGVAAGCAGIGGAGACRLPAPAILTPGDEDAGPCGYLSEDCPTGHVPACCVNGMQCSVPTGCESAPPGPWFADGKAIDGGADAARDGAR